MAIPKVFIKEGIQATKAAKEAVAKITNATKKEVITTEKLFGNSASDLFEKKAYMEAEAFWHEPQTFANYARGQYLTEGGQAFQQSQKIENKIIGNSGNLERGFVRYLSQSSECINYYERNLLTGNAKLIELYNGHPYRSLGNSSELVYHNMKTGAPCKQNKVLEDTKGKIIGNELTRFGEDGKTIISRELNSIFGRTVREYAPDGSYTAKKYVGNNVMLLEKYSKEGTPIRKIELHQGTKQPFVINDYDKQGKMIRTQMFDTHGNLTTEY